MINFAQLGLNPHIVKILKGDGLVTPTPIQEKAIPAILNGKDVIAQAQTGTGKTLAFVLPILEKIDPNQNYVQALIVTPTRELALQITSEVKKLIANMDDINVLAVYGGQDVERQIKKLKGSKQIVIGTPGRLLDHLRRGTIVLNKISTLVIDEADQMLHMGFIKEVEELIGQLPFKRQTILTSATMSQPVRNLAQQYLQKPEDIVVKGNQITLDEIKQLVFETTDRTKLQTLQDLINQYRPYLAIIFCRTKRRASKLNSELQDLGYESDELHGDLSQAKREQVMKNFREAKLQLLVATDVAARGLDVEGVTHVFNYDIPHDAESYIHRIGRTGRAGGKGIAITLATSRDKRYLELIEKGIKGSIEKRSNINEQPKKAQTERKIDAKKGQKKKEFKTGKDFKKEKESKWGQNRNSKSGSRRGSQGRNPAKKSRKGR